MSQSRGLDCLGRPEDACRYIAGPLRSHVLLLGTDSRGAARIVKGDSSSWPLSRRGRCGRKAGTTVLAAGWTAAERIRKERSGRPDGKYGGGRKE